MLRKLPGHWLGEEATLWAEQDHRHLRLLSSPHSPQLWGGRGGEGLVGEEIDRSRWSHLDLNQRQEKALTYLLEKGRITNREYQELCPDVSSETIRRDLADLVSKNVLLKIGRKRATYYIFK
ncbi:MAG: DeoR family transcriptional regulator [Anaerolineae bacterium]|nr:DeoR family transcriptional regulator [Anaerolineae bacterium]